MIDWTDKIGRSSLVCAHSGEPIPPGSTLCSALQFQGDHFQRLDFHEEHWPAVDHSRFVSWWLHRLPPAKATSTSTLNVEQLLQIFLDIADTRRRPQQCLAYCLALLLMRAKKLRFLGMDESASEPRLLYENRSDRSCYRLRDPHMNETELERVQAELTDLIGY
ncbi:MAG: hypothetical protein ACOCXJ_02290 [Planctomycetota bacterium]